MFFADLASDVHVIELDGTDGFSVNGVSVLAFEPTLQWDIKMIGSAGMIGGGLFNTYFTGSGKLAITTKGTPVVLTVDAPTFVDTDAVVAWSASLQTSIRTGGFKPMAMIRGSGEAFQLGFAGQGFVIVQPSENPPRAQGGQPGRRRHRRDARQARRLTAAPRRLRTSSRTDAAVRRSGAGRVRPAYGVRRPRAQRSLPAPRASAGRPPSPSTACSAGWPSARCVAVLVAVPFTLLMLLVLSEWEPLDSSTAPSPTR